MKNKINGPVHYWRRQIKFVDYEEYNVYRYMREEMRGNEAKKFRGKKCLNIAEWREYVTETYRKCNIDDLKEFSDFLNYKRIATTSHINYTKIVLTPLVTTMIISMLGEFYEIWEQLDSASGWEFVILAVLVVAAGMFVFWLFMSKTYDWLIRPENKNVFYKEYKK